jgi:hypothetical protein
LSTDRAPVVEQMRRINIIDQNILVWPAEFQADHETVARQRVPRDPGDWPTVALALDADIWAADTDFPGCGVPTWTTETLVIDAEA